jgi:hypothetical protein
MADIICTECKSSVSDESGHCPECGYPFDFADTGQQTDQSIAVPGEVPGVQQKTITTTPLDIILQSLDSVRLEINGLQRTVNDVRKDLDSLSMSSNENTQKVLTEIVAKLDNMSSVIIAREAGAKSETPQKKKIKLLEAFYKTLNSPNSMFEYMFYICVVQIIFVIVNLFLVTYIVTLVRD